MKLFRFIPICAAAAALILVPTVSAAQMQQTAETTKKAEKTAKKKVKRTEEKAGEATGNATAAGNSTPEAAGKTKSKAGGSAQRAVTTGSAQRAMPTVSESEIAAAKADGKVWVNTETRVYHKGGRWYGATKQGKFMTEDEAKKAGYRASKGKE